MAMSDVATAEEPGGQESARARAYRGERVERAKCAGDSAESDATRLAEAGRPERPHLRSIVVQGPAERFGELARALARRVRERPMVSVAAAIGVGFLVGGALSFRAGRIALGVAARRVAREVLKQLL